MTEDSILYIGVDASKTKHAIAVAENGRSGEVRYVGEIETNPSALSALSRKWSGKAADSIFAMRRVQPATASIVKLSRWDMSATLSRLL